MPPVGPVGLSAQPSSCQRTRSASAAAVNPCAWCQVRSWRSPCSVSTRTRQVVITIPRPATSAWSSSASCLATNTTGPLWSTAGSKGRWTVSSGGGARVPGGRSSRPAAAWWARKPSEPKRPRTSAAGRAASWARVRRPRRWNTPGQVPVHQPHVGQRHDREGGEEGRRATVGHHQPARLAPQGLGRGGASRQGGGEPAVRHPHPRRAGGPHPAGEDRGHGLGHQRGEAPRPLRGSGTDRGRRRSPSPARSAPPGA